MEATAPTREGLAEGSLDCCGGGGGGLSILSGLGDGDVFPLSRSFKARGNGKRPRGDPVRSKRTSPAASLSLCGSTITSMESSAEVIAPTQSCNASKASV